MKPSQRVTEGRGWGMQGTGGEGTREGLLLLPGEPVTRPCSPLPGSSCLVPGFLHPNQGWKEPALPSLRVGEGPNAETMDRGECQGASTPASRLAPA